MKPSSETHRHLLALAVFALLLPASLAQCQHGTNYTLTCRPDKPDSLYEISQPVRFLLKLELEGKPVNEASLKWHLSKDGVPPIREGQVTLSDGQAVVTGNLNEPGFLLLRATFEAPGGRTITDAAGAGIQPLDIKPSLPVPDDFDSFWATQKAKLARIPMNPQLTPVTPDQGVDSFDVQLDCVGAPVSGYFSRPRQAKRASLPAILSVHGAGVRSSSLPFTVTWAKDGLLAMDINAHGIANGKPAEFYQQLAQGDLKAYSHHGRESRETLYFLGMFLRVIRALDFLAAQPEWDGRTLIVSGSSQGGAQAIAAAGLDPRVTFFTASVPAMCDHTGMVAGRVSGWPKLVPVTGSAPDRRVLEVSRYFDAVNFANRTRASALFTVGFIDTTCPPTTVYAAYNALPGSKSIYNDIRSRHENTPGAIAAVRQSILRHLKDPHLVVPSGASAPRK